MPRIVANRKSRQLIRLIAATAVIIPDGANGNSRADYNDWEVKLSKQLWHLDWSLSYIDTDLSDTECESFMGYRDVCGSTLVAGVSTTF